MSETSIYSLQGFGGKLDPLPPYGLVIIDFVNGFADPNTFGGGNIAQAITNTVPLLAFARQHNWPIAHTRIVFADDGADTNVFSLKVPTMLGLTEDNPNSHIVPELAPKPGELVVRKTVPSAFFGTSLAAWLTQRGVKTLLVAGAVTSGCIRASVVDAMQLGFRPFVISDCVGDRALAPHEANLFDMKEKYATVISRDEVIGKIKIES